VKTDTTSVTAAGYVFRRPTCKGKFIDVPNITLEKNAATAIYQCQKREAGCEETFTVDDRNKHQFVCLYDRKECPFRKLSDVDCSWTATPSDIAAHVSSDHSIEAFQSETVAYFQRNTLLDGGTDLGGIILFDLGN
jgi:hypothetical protein